MVTTITTTALTRRQIQCLELAGKGLTSKEIARELNISHRTVEQHLSAAFKTLGVTNRIAAIDRLAELTSGSAQVAPPFMLSQSGSEVGLDLVQRNDQAPPTVTALDISALPPLGGKSNGQTRKTRRILIFRIAMLALMLTSIACLSVLAALELADRVS